MGVEIERKYLVQSMDWIKQAGDGTRLVQGYLATTDKTAIRVRIAGSPPIPTGVEAPGQSARPRRFPDPWVQSFPGMRCLQDRGRTRRNHRGCNEAMESLIVGLALLGLAASAMFVWPDHEVVRTAILVAVIGILSVSAVLDPGHRWADASFVVIGLSAIGRAKGFQGSGGRAPQA